MIRFTWNASVIEWAFGNGVHRLKGSTSMSLLPRETSPKPDKMYRNLACTHYSQVRVALGKGKGKCLTAAGKGKKN